MAGSFVSRAARALRDPWSLVVAGVGAGSAWAIGLPVGAVGLVGAGMLGVAAVVGGADPRRRWRRAEPAPPPLRPGTVQAQLVGTLHGLPHRPRTAAAGTPWRPPSGSSAVQAVEAARSAESVANRVARAVDAVDDAVGRAEGVARQMPRSGEVRASVQRMLQRRHDLLTKLTDAVDEVGEVYAKLLELSTTANLVGVRHRRGDRSRAGQRFAGRHPRGVRRTGGRRLDHPRPALTDRRTDWSNADPCGHGNPAAERVALTSVGCDALSSPQPLRETRASVPLDPPRATRRPTLDRLARPRSAR